MPRSGAVTLRDLIASDGKSHIIIACQPCGREGRYSVSRLLETLGDMGLSYAILVTDAVIYALICYPFFQGAD